jgi:hypothetical protein
MDGSGKILHISEGNDGSFAVNRVRQRKTLARPIFYAWPSKYLNEGGLYY